MQKSRQGRTQPGGRRLLEVGVIVGLVLLLTAPVAAAFAPDSQARGKHGPPAGTQGWTRGRLPGGLRGVYLHGVSCTFGSCLVFGQLCRSSTCGLDTPQVALASTDSGASWTRATVPTDFLFAYQGMTCSSPTWCVAGGVRNPASPTPTPSFALTRNLGDSWKVKPITAIGTLSSLTCANTRVCYAVGAANPPISQIPFGQIAVTSNRGATWTTKSFPSTGLVTGIACATPRVCTAYGTSLELGSVVFLRTVNGGASWTTRGEPLSFGMLQTLTCPSTTECLIDVVHPNDVSSIDVTHDGAKTWANRSIGRDALLYGVSCASPGSCTFVGVTDNTPLVSPTAQRGRPWPLLKISRFGSGQLWAISCEVKSHCVAVGQQWDRKPIDGGAQIFIR